MPVKRLAAAFPVLMIVFLVVPVRIASAQTLRLTAVPDKQEYNSVGETVYISGNLTEGGLPVSDALVAIEVDNPKGNLFVIRTLTTGPIDPNEWPLEILELFPCDSAGNPKYSFQPGDNAGISIKAKNRADNPNDVVITLTVVYSNKAPFRAFSIYAGSISGGQTIAITTWPVPIPEDAVTGNATIFGNIYNVLPKDNGFAYCPEKSASFLIGTSGQGQSTTNSSGQFTLEIKLSRITIWIGNYTIYATAKYSFLAAFSTSTFEIILIGDLYPDGKVDMRDVAIVARAFGTKAGDPDWDPIADLYPDSRIDMRDVAIVARAFGTKAGDS